MPARETEQPGNRKATIDGYFEKNKTWPDFVPKKKRLRASLVEDRPV